MKVVLSRKGFDSSYGGCASPILQDGTMLSLPIPGKSNTLYLDLSYKGYNYDDIWKSLATKSKYHENWQCHLDPDIRENIIIKGIDDWKPAFGQEAAAQGVVLTKEDQPKRTVWKLLPWMINNTITYNMSGIDLENQQFNSAYRGQEFVVSENDEVIEWAADIIQNNYSTNDVVI